jgi:hypothetical protein
VWLNVIFSVSTSQCQRVYKKFDMTKRVRPKDLTYLSLWRCVNARPQFRCSHSHWSAEEAASRAEPALVTTPSVGLLQLGPARLSSKTRLVPCFVKVDDGVLESKVRSGGMYATCVPSSGISNSSVSHARIVVLSRPSNAAGHIPSTSTVFCAGYTVSQPSNAILSHPPNPIHQIRPPRHRDPTIPARSGRDFQAAQKTLHPSYEILPVPYGRDPQDWPERSLLRGRLIELDHFDILAE